jgi:hypothetical protein
MHFPDHIISESSTGVSAVSSGLSPAADIPGIFDMSVDPASNINNTSPLSFISLYILFPCSIAILHDRRGIIIFVLKPFLIMLKCPLSVYADI